MRWKKQIIVHNEAVNDKLSPVEIGWQDLKKNISKELKQKNIKPHDPEQYILKLYDNDKNRNEIPFQIDRLLLKNPEHDKLVFISNASSSSVKEYFLCGYLLNETKNNEKVPVFYPEYPKFDFKPAFNYNSTINWPDFENKTNHLFQVNPHRALIYQFNDEGDLWLRNFIVKFCFHTKSDWQSPNGHVKRSGYAGCSSYMVVENREDNANPYDILNIYDNPDIQKKGMQVEKIELDLSNLGDSLMFYPKDFNYEIISIINGPVRASLVVRISLPWGNQIPSSKVNKAGTKHASSFYRCLHLYPGKYYVKEDIFTLGESNELLNFKVDFCTNHNFTFAFRQYRGISGDSKVEIEDWFSFGDPTTRYNPQKQIPEKAIVGYGFASNCGEKFYESNLTNCRWSLKKTQYVHCLHKPLCTKNTYTEFEDEYHAFPHFSENIGDEWYDVIYVNLWAELIPGIEKQ